MSEKKIKTRIQQKHDIEVNWLLATNFIPMAGEIIIYDIEVDANGNTLKDSNGKALLPEGRTEPYAYERFKIGDGQTLVSDLPFIGLWVTAGQKRSTVLGRSATAEGYQTTASGTGSHAEGLNTTASGGYSHAEGNNTKASNYVSHAEGGSTEASGESSHAEGESTTASGNRSHAEGSSTTASAAASHAEGWRTSAAGKYSHTEGGDTTASGDASHAEGLNTTAFGIAAHAEGSSDINVGLYNITSDTTFYQLNNLSGIPSRCTRCGAPLIPSVPFDGSTDRICHCVKCNVFFTESSKNTELFSIAFGEYSHVEGKNNIAYGAGSHAEGTNTVARSENSHAGGKGTIASRIAQTAIGRYNEQDDNALFIIGNGYADNNRSNALAVKDDGHVILGCQLDFTDETLDSQTAATVGYVQGITTTASKIVDISYIHLVELRDNGELIPGQFYKIIDYECTTTQEETRAVNTCKFNIIVQATSSNTLSEIAKASGTSVKIENGLKVGSVDYSYAIFEDSEEGGDYGGIGGQSHNDIFIAYDYLYNNEDELVPVLYKTDYDSNDPEFQEPDYGDTYYYVGTYEYEGETYDRWRKIEDNGQYDWDTEAKQYALTNVIVENNTIMPEYLGDGTLDNCGDINFDAWELKYCLDNDTSRFAWADESDCGRGVIYYMKDEWNNECPYDFKNIQFTRPISFDENGYITYDPDNGEDTWVYTFTAFDVDNDEYLDASIITGQIVIEDGTPVCYGNSIRNQYDPSTHCTQLLNDIVFLNAFSLNNVDYFYCNSNTFGHGCNSITFGNDCDSNTFGNGCEYSTFGNLCNSNTFGHGCNSITFGNNCGSNTFGNVCNSNTFGNRCNYNTFGTGCSDNTFGNSCYYNTFGNSCSNNTFGNVCNSNTFGNSCSNNTFGTTKQLIDYVYFTKFSSGCSYISLLNTETASSSGNSVQNVTIGPGVCGTYDKYRELQVQRKAAPVVFEAAGTTHIILD